MTSPEIYGLFCRCEKCRPDPRIRYVGQALHGAEGRVARHLREAHKSDSKCGRWIVKHGIENIFYEVLVRCTAEELDFYEIKLIHELETLCGEHEDGLNLETGGRYVTTFSSTTRKLLSSRMIDRWKDEAYRESMTSGARSHLNNTEWRAWFAQRMNDSTVIENCRNGQLRRYQDEEQRIRHRQIRSTDEYKKSASIAAKNQWKDKSNREQMIASIRESITDETRHRQKLGLHRHHHIEKENAKPKSTCNFCVEEGLI